MSEAPDLRKFLNGWPYDPENNVRFARVADGREIIVVRQPMGLETYEVDGRPDGQHPYGMESALDFQLTRLVAARRAGAEAAFKLTAADCAELFHDGSVYHYRIIQFFRLKDWRRAERDTVRNLRLIDFVAQYAEHREDRAQFEQWRPTLVRTNVLACKALLLKRDPPGKALGVACANYEPVENRLDTFREHVHSLLQGLETFHPVLCQIEDSAFMRQGEYWAIRYQGQTAHLKDARGLHCLNYLLRHPRREIHVSELLEAMNEVPTSALLHSFQNAGGQLANTVLHGAGPILDLQAKEDYKRRIAELRRDLKEAERFNDSYRAAQASTEMDLIAQQLASAVGLGGRDRRASSDAERARSAVTKRIKEAIGRIAEIIPALGSHLATRIKTGYFCSYNPHPDHTVAWKF